MSSGRRLGHSSPPLSGTGRDDLSSRSLSQLAAARVSLMAYCRRCKHRALLYPAALAEKLGPERKATEVARRLKCSECGSRGETLRVTEVER